MRTDEAILSAIAAGELTAVGELYDRYHASLFPMLLRITRDRGEAEDVLHDAFVLVSERASQYAAARGSVAAWLVTMVRNLAIDRTRRRDRRAALATADAQTKPAHADPAAEGALDEQKEAASVRAALGTLPEAQRLTLEKAFYEGLSYPEIAEAEGVPLGTVKSRAARALAALRDALAKRTND
jgi:RNA polymerase sigma-70 factor (ECF subfamily)